MSVASQSGIRPIDVNGGEEVVTVGSGDPGSTRDAEEKEEETETGGEERGVARMLDPRQPSEEERRTHNLTHLPYRNWCEHCVKGRGREADHKQLKSQPEVGGRGCMNYILTTCSWAPRTTQVRPSRS